ncbi:chromosome partitioning protein [Deinococcus cavernae]|uniref:Chromosome partitioning protein n=1 Tax=Deinococcus cavernae TaxID=2320857 RepID=A0A418V767_9DEIO|nr:tyrosine-protein kinase domain-containing protein [Deinococcus cavernae]RJF71953.1 chromosome partitioning protein [Deinococcus cavernae]
MTERQTTTISEDLDMERIFRVIRRQWLPILSATLLTTAGTYALSQRQTPIYAATGSVMAAAADVGNSVVNSGVVATPQLPQGAVAEVLQSRRLLKRVTELIQETELPAPQKNQITARIQNELSNNIFTQLTVRARVDALQRGIYEVNALANTPNGARVLADSALTALLEWDTDRAKRGVNLARRTLEGQVRSLDQQLALTPPNSQEREALLAARGQARLNLSQVQVLEQTTTGNLVLLSEANTSRRPIAPRPTRNAALAGLLTFMAGVGLAMILDALRRRVRSGADLINLDVPVIGELPRLRSAQRSQIVNEAFTGELYDPSGFMRVNLTGLAEAAPGQPLSFVVTSARPGEGKSTVVASMASSFAASGQRVLVIDLDVHRPTQHEYWNTSGRPWIPLQGAVEGRPITLLKALIDPQHASAVDLGNGVFLMPAGEGTRREAGILTTQGFTKLVKQWMQGFDIVILDSAPVLSVADSLVIAPRTNGMVLVVEANGTSMNEIQRVLQNVRSTQVNLLGIVLNKLSRGQRGYGYSYSYGKSYSRSGTS